MINRDLLAAWSQDIPKSRDGERGRLCRVEILRIILDIDSYHPRSIPIYFTFDSNIALKKSIVNCHENIFTPPFVLAIDFIIRWKMCA